MSIFEILLIVWVFFGCVYWLWTALGAVRVVRAVPKLDRCGKPEPQTWPRLSVIIPACNEADTLEAAMATILRLDYPDLEIVLINDRSTDATGQIVDRIAASDARVRPLHVTELPEGWLGKVYALNCGVEMATGDWLLFTDADVHFEPATLRHAVAYGQHRELDHLAAVPDMWPASFPLAMVTAAFLRSFCVLMRCWAIEDPRSSAFIGVGAFNLVRRTAYEKTEGFPWLRLEVADDVGLGMMMKRSGARCCLVNAAGMVGLHWYRTLGEMARGAEKGYASIAHCSMLRMVVVILLLSALELAPLAAFLPVGHGGMLPAGLAMVAAAVFSNVLLRRWDKSTILPALCFPLAVPIHIVLLVRTAWLGFIRGGVVWRGTLYPSKILREGARVKIL